MLRCTSQQDLNQVKIVGKLICGVGKLISRVLDKEFWGKSPYIDSTLFAIDK
ncbi:MAG: hypothetical protein WCS10_07825 [Bacteroidales bacterium]